MGGSYFVHILYADTCHVLIMIEYLKFLLYFLHSTLVHSFLHRHLTLPNIKEVNSFWSSDAIWRQRSESTLAQVMPFCLMAPSHYLHQCWFIIKGILWHSPESNSTRNARGLNHVFGDYTSKITTTAPSELMSQWLTYQDCDYWLVLTTCIMFLFFFNFLDILLCIFLWLRDTILWLFQDNF